ncbi:MAG: methyltransferase domain-containing protein [Acidimicrobiaceae bacterium]|nr:methyltransferase domain-containing protein [Acidimicrobiaceae bacterium]
MKLTDPTQGLKQSALERVPLKGESLQNLSEFWDDSARIDTVRSIADSDDEVSFETSGRADAAAVLAIAPENAVVLEIGCGVGRIMQHLAPATSQVHGIDISSEMIERGSRRLGHLPNVHFHLGNGYDLEVFSDETFDVVFAWVVFQHMPKTVAFNYLTEVQRVLKPGGRFRLQVPNILRQDQFHAFRHFSQPFYAEHPYPMNFYTPMEVIKLVAEAGLVIDSIDDRTVAVARRRLPDEPDPPDGVQELLMLPESEPIRRRIEQLEADLEHVRLELRRASYDAAVMRRVYEHPVVRAARTVRRSARRMRGFRPGS